MNRLERQRRITERLASMTAEQYAITCNGVGPKMTLWLGGDGLSCLGVIPFARWLRVPERIKLLLRGAADLHDIGYDIGGDEVDKMHDDTWFLANGLDAVYAQDVGFFVRLYDRVWVYICYTLVRVLGGQFFNYRN